MGFNSGFKGLINLNLTPCKKVIGWHNGRNEEFRIRTFGRRLFRRASRWKDNIKFDLMERSSEDKERMYVNMKGTCSTSYICVCNSAIRMGPPTPRFASQWAGPMIGNERSRAPRVACRELEILPDGAAAT